MEQDNLNNKWYDNKAIVILLIILFFPVGLFAMWKSNSFSKKWKIGVSAFFVLLFIISIATDDKSDQKDRNKSVSYEKIKEDKKSDFVKTEEPQNLNSFQNIFVSQKIEQFSSQIKEGKSANEIKSEANETSKNLLKKENNELTDWEGEIISIDMFKDKELDLSITIQKRKIVGQKTISGKTMDCGITIEASQGTNKKFGFKGISRNGELYEKVKNLKEGDKVIFSAKVIDVWDNNEATGLNLSTILHIALTDIRKK